MTTGQRISEKRKELGLSQEALGEKLGVSRQSIYKWESDASLPDIDKLIALSRLFGVPVGWLLGVEEVPSPVSAAEEPQEDWEARQEQLVEEVLLRYQQSQPKQKKSKLAKWGMPILFAIMLVSMYTINAKVERMDSRYNGLQNSINNVSSSVNSQIGSIADRVEEILKSQNELTADYGTELLSGDLKRNTVTFSARAVPKTYVEGMEVVFLIDSGDGPTEFTAEAGPGREFTAELTCTLTDSITVSAVFLNGDTRQTQILDTYEGLYSGSLPEVNIQGLEGAYMHEELQSDGLFHLPTDVGWINRIESETKFGTVSLDTASLRMGLFQNHQLVSWLEPCSKPENWNVDGEYFFRVPDLELSVEPGDVLHFALFYSDEFGRQAVYPSLPPFVRQGDSITWPSGSSYADYNDIKEYDLTPK